MSGPSALVYKTTDVRLGNSRKLRAINTVRCAIPISGKKNDPIKFVIFHKNQSGYIMLALNCCGKIIRSWTSTSSESPIIGIKSLIVKEDQFRSILGQIPVNSLKCLYIKDGEPLKPLNSYNISLYRCSLMELLCTFENTKRPCCDCKANKRNDTVSFETMQLLDPTITKSSYKKFIKQLEGIK